MPTLCVIIPFTAIQEYAAILESHSTSSQNLNKSRRSSSLDRWHRKFPHWVSLPIDAGLCAVAIKKVQPIEGGRDVPFAVLALVEHLKSFVWATPNIIEFSLVSIFRYYHPPSLPNLRHSNSSVRLQDHMHLAWTFLREHAAHIIEGTFGPMHVITEGRRFICMRSHSGKIQRKMGCTSLINVDR